MKIQNKDFYHGVVLTQIAEYPTFSSINKVTEKEGLYQLNNDKRILIKYSTSDEGEWRFTFSRNDLESIDHHYEFFIILVCGGSSICLLSSEDIEELLDTDADSSQWISIDYLDGEQIRVKGSLGDLSHTVAHNAFPKNLLGAVSKAQEVYSWPPLSKLNFYKQPPKLILSSEDRMLDLADRLAYNVSFKEDTTVYLGLTTISHLWEAWTEENLRKVEELIKYDLGFDGFNVEIERITDVICPYTKKQDIPCNEEFVWKLNISVALDEVEEA
jgi:hypothetical protein